MNRWTTLVAVLSMLIAPRAFARCWLEPTDTDVAFVCEVGYAGRALDSELGQGLLGLGRILASNASPAVYQGAEKLWSDLGLSGLSDLTLSGRIGVVVLGGGQWAAAAELQVANAFELVERLGARARSIGPNGSILTLGDGRYVATVRPGRALDGSEVAELATIILAPESSAALVKRLGKSLLSDAGVLAPGEKLDGVDGQSSWVRLFTQLPGGYASVEARGRANHWSVRARVPSSFIAGDQPAALTGLDQATFDRVSEGAVVAVAGLADVDLVRRAPVLGAVVDLLPADQRALIDGRPAILTARVNQDEWGTRRLGFLVLLRGDGLEPTAIDAAMDRAAVDLGLLASGDVHGFGGFRPEAARRRPIDGPTRELLVPVLGQSPMLEWARVRADDWWAIRLAHGESRVEEIRSRLWTAAAVEDSPVLSFGRVRPAGIASSPRAAAVMSSALSGSVARIGEVRWQTLLPEADIVEVTIEIDAAR